MARARKFTEEIITISEDFQPTIFTQRRYRLILGGDNGLIHNRMASPFEKDPNDKTKITHEDKEKRDWLKKLYYDEELGLYVPSENIHQCFKDGAKFWGSKIPGEGQKTYTDVIASTVVILSAILIDEKGEKIPKESAIPYGCWVNVGAGKKGSKVWRIRPMIQPWRLDVEMLVFDARLTVEVLKTVIAIAGGAKGLCDNRPYFGRFHIESMEEIS